MDGGSCGVFVLAAADCLAAGALVSFTQADIPVLRSCMALALVADDLTANLAASYFPEEDAGPLGLGALLNAYKSAADVTEGMAEIDLSAEIHDGGQADGVVEMDGGPEVNDEDQEEAGDDAYEVDEDRTDDQTGGSSDDADLGNSADPGEETGAEGAASDFDETLAAAGAATNF